mmetsp:Transcript_53355/g.165400  ORF Transcript_53355/g.165400 Transcript_53355/m.165400 type:complete len:217 (+) Transcript_53355:256-906(+)
MGRSAGRWPGPPKAARPKGHPPSPRGCLPTRRGGSCQRTHDFAASYASMPNPDTGTARMHAGTLPFQKCNSPCVWSICRVYVTGVMGTSLRCTPVLTKSTGINRPHVITCAVAPLKNRFQYVSLPTNRFRSMLYDPMNTQPNDESLASEADNPRQSERTPFCLMRSRMNVKALRCWSRVLVCALILMTWSGVPNKEPVPPLKRPARKEFQWSPSVR